jgi:hypothetical protein
MWCNNTQAYETLHLSNVWRRGRQHCTDMYLKLLEMLLHENCFILTLEASADERTNVSHFWILKGCRVSRIKWDWHISEFCSASLVFCLFKITASTINIILSSNEIRTWLCKLNWKWLANKPPCCISRYYILQERFRNNKKSYCGKSLTTDSNQLLVITTKHFVTVCFVL